LQLLKETGARAGEAVRIEWTDIDTENSTIRISPEKGSNPRMFKISSKLLATLSNQAKKSNLIFSCTAQGLGHSYRRQRRRIALKLGNPRIDQIKLHTFRHWKATMEYHRTKDILYVKQLLGHKKLENTLIYTQLVNFQDDEFTCKVAKTVQEAAQLIEAGFDYVTDIDNCKLFRKRK
jgi:integrase/recombinase XerD